MIKSLLLSTLFACLLFSSHAQELQIDINQLINETQISQGTSGEIKMNWWIPSEFWIGTFQNEPSLAQSEVDDFMKLLSPYSIFAVIDGEIGQFGGVTYASESDIANSIVMTDSKGKKHKPLNVEDLSADLQNLLAMFKPILINMIGEMGENMHFFVFSDQDVNGNRIADPTKEGSLMVKVMDLDYTWVTPLSSVLPNKFCPRDGESMSGTWNYCPIHGDALKTTK